MEDGEAFNRNMVVSGAANIRYFITEAPSHSTFSKLGAEQRNNGPGGTFYRVAFREPDGLLPRFYLPRPNLECFRRKCVNFCTEI